MQDFLFNSLEHRVKTGGLDEITSLVNRQSTERNQTFAFWTLRFEKFIFMGYQDFMYKVYESDMRILNDDFSVQFDYILVIYQSFIYETLNDFILRCNEHGFTKIYKSLYCDQPIIKNHDKPVVLTMQMLSAGFYLWLCSVAVACIVFICEHMTVNFTRIRQTKKRTEIKLTQNNHTPK